MDELNDKQGKKIKKKSQMVVKQNPGSEQREVPGLNLQRQAEFRDFDTSKTPF